MNNTQIAQILYSFADYLEINMDNPYRIRAYRRAARSIEKNSQSLEALIKKDFDLTALPNIGKNIADHIEVIIQTGNLPETLIRKNHEKRFRNQLKEIVGLGPKRLRLLKEKLGIDSIDSLKNALNMGKLNTLPGFTPALQQKILYGIHHPKPYQKIIAIRLASLILESLQRKIAQLKYVKKVVIAGQYRRKTELLNEGVLIIITDQSQTVINDIIQSGEVKEWLVVESNKASVILNSGFKITLITTEDTNFGTVLLHATGSDEHLQQLIR